MKAPMAACLQDFLERYKDSAVDKLFAEFCGVTTHTVARWRRGKGLPKGDEALRIQVFLDMVGYRVAEFVTLPPPLQSLNKMIAFRVVDIAAVQKKLEYVNLQSLYRTLRGGGIATNKQYLITRYVEDQSLVESEQAAWLTRWESLQQGFPDTSSQPAVQKPAAQVLPKRSAAAKPAGDDPVATAQIVTHLLQAIDTAISETHNTSELADLVRARTSPKRLKAVRTFLDRTLSSENG